MPEIEHTDALQPAIKILPPEQDEKAPEFRTDSYKGVRFLGVELEVAHQVAIPRVETELLVREALERLDEIAFPTVVDMCCGSGAIALAMADHRADATLYACDLLEGAVALAARNAARHSLYDRVTVLQGDLFSAFEGTNVLFDMVVANPPYISTGRLETERAHLLADEPREAFDAGPYGLAIHQRLVREAPNFLKPGGWLVFEFGHGQERQVAALAARNKAYDPLVLAHDSEGAPRVAILRFTG